jgi:hypothetical protein
MRRRATLPRRLVALCVGTLALGSCEITEEILAPSADVLVLEGLVQLRDDIDGQRILVFLHRTVADGRSLAVPGASVTVTPPSGETLVLLQSPNGQCVASTPEVEDPGTCYYLAEEGGLGLAPGDRLELHVETTAGETLRAATTIPGGIDILNSDDLDCWQPEDSRLELTWTASEGAWAYVSEMLLVGLDEALRREGITLGFDPLFLTGLAISSSDTTISYPNEFGVFDRADLAPEVAVRLQQGVPLGVAARISVAAVDRNYVNWVRGGNFNPSGLVRVPSVRGDGTGYFGSAVVEPLTIISATLESPGTRCRVVEPE